MQATATAHIVVDDRNVAWIDGTRIKVMHLVRNQQAYGWTPEQVREQYPHLTLAEIHAAFAYYYDHQAEIDAQLRQAQTVCDAMARTTGPQPMRKSSGCRNGACG